MSPAIVVVLLLSRNSACREMWELSERTVNGAHRTVTSESGFVGITLLKRLNDTPAPAAHGQRKAS